MKRFAILLIATGLCTFGFAQHTKELSGKRAGFTEKAAAQVSKTPTLKKGKLQRATSARHTAKFRHVKRRPSARAVRSRKVQEMPRPGEPRLRSERKF